MEPSHIAEIKQAFQEKTAQTPGLTPDQEKQILHEIITERTARPQPQTSTAQNDTDTQTSAQQQASQQPVQPLVQQEPYGSQRQAVVHTLVQMAVHEDLYKATRLAYETKNPYLIDQYHDTLVDQFYQMIKDAK